MNNSNSGNNNNSGSSPVSQRRSLTASQMDAIGRMDEETGQPVSLLLDNKSKVTPPASPSRSMVATGTLEIGTRVDVGSPVDVIPPMEIENDNNDDDSEEDDDDDVDADLERLLASTEEGGTTRSKQQAPSSRRGCWRCGCTCAAAAQAQRGPGNFVIVFPRIYAKTGWGIVGPHWFGPFFVLLIILWASHFFIQSALNIGPITTTCCIVLTCVTIWNLGVTSFHDPGIVSYTTLPDHVVDVSRWRWCDFCNVYQPPNGQHCHECGVCVEGHDHHCVWMGTCIGKKNFRQFVRFNLSWLLYLVYAVSWVSILGPTMYHHHKRAN